MARPENYSDALLRLVKSINETGIRYALTGAAAVGYYGIPRSSMDIDVIITGDLSKPQVESLTSALILNGFTVNRDEVGRAFAGQEAKFQAFDDRTGYLRVDVFLEHSFDRVEDRIDGLKVWFRTFEDLVAKKVQYGDLDEVRQLLQLRGKRVRKEKIVQFLNDRQKKELEQLFKQVNAK